MEIDPAALNGIAGVTIHLNLSFVHVHYIMGCFLADVEKKNRSIGKERAFLKDLNLNSNVDFKDALGQEPIF